MNKPFTTALLNAIQHPKPQLLALLAASALAPYSLTGGAQEACLNDEAQFNNAVCTANDVRISRIDVLDGPVECIEGADVSINSMVAVLEGGAKERYDIGIYFATDGGDAKASMSGQNDGCIRDFLTPLGDGDGAFDDLDGDSCGDITQGTTEMKQLDAVNLTCTDSDDNGFLDVGSCLSWDNNTKGACGGVDDVAPGTPSKCRCEPIQVGEIVVIPRSSIVIRKEVTGGQVDTQWGFTYMDQSFQLGDGEQHSLEGLTAGSYIVSEDPDGTSILESISCDDEDSTTDTDARQAMVELDDDETVTCTFTNALVK
ncbi:hypothetical protein [Parahaliea mediterranea]|uniref:Uncharacterized protein n=1 Tax=Parahaliea mediterranea TaxID=651086 RepID=A0A939DE37_9GAMM|nr:hypothetical protein [Parahaliea mediterranea]MBN7796506.1 hypothetical protein [Parahaliea mediterranea]